MSSYVDATALRSKLSVDTEFVNAQGRNFDMWVACFLASGFVAVGVATTVDPVLSTPFAAVASVLALYVFYRMFRIRSVRARVDAAWKSAFSGCDLHTPSGESVEFISYNDTYRTVWVAHKDGKRQELPLDALVDGRGQKVVHDAESDASLTAAILKRWSSVRWKLDDGRVGTLREVVTVGYEYFDTTKLSLKLDDGNVVSEDIKLLTPVPSR